MRFEHKVEQLRIAKHGGKETREFLEDVQKLTDGEAFEYLMGEVRFCDVKVDLSLRPMIPRPETEFWVTKAIEEILMSKARFSLRILDLFSGSGNVGLAILKHIPEASVDFIEVDPKLSEQINISILKNNIKKTRTRVIVGDMWEGAVGTYDYIFAVPPYVPPQMKDEVMEELSAESPLSFFDKEDGFYYHTQILSRAKEFLKDGGTMYLEFDMTQREKIEQLALSHGFISCSFFLDPYGHECTIKLVK